MSSSKNCSDLSNYEEVSSPVNVKLWDSYMKMKFGIISTLEGFVSRVIGLVCLACQVTGCTRHTRNNLSDRHVRITDLFHSLLFIVMIKLIFIY